MIIEKILHFMYKRYCTNVKLYDEVPMSYNIWLITVFGDVYVDHDHNVRQPYTKGERYVRKVWQWVETLLTYNMFADVIYVHSDGSSDGTISINGYGGGDGCTKEDCDNVSLVTFEENNENTYTCEVQ